MCIRDRPKYELSDSISVQPGDSFLLCSDGYWEWILENKMAKYLKKAATPGEWLKTMEAEIQKNGRKANMDNYTACLLYTSDFRKKDRCAGIWKIFIPFLQI